MTKSKERFDIQDKFKNILTIAYHGDSFFSITVNGETHVSDSDNFYHALEYMQQVYWRDRDAKKHNKRIP